MPGRQRLSVTWNNWNIAMHFLSVYFEKFIFF